MKQLTLYSPEYTKADLPERFCPNNGGCFERTMEVLDRISAYEHTEVVKCYDNNLIATAHIENDEIITITDIEKL